MLLLLPAHCELCVLVVMNWSAHAVAPLLRELIGWRLDNKVRTSGGRGSPSQNQVWKPTHGLDADDDRSR